MPTPRTFDLTPLIQAAAHELGAPICGDRQWLSLGVAELDVLSASDRELVHVVTGERLPGFDVSATPRADEIGVSFFTMQLVADRTVGPLRDGDDVPTHYVEDVYTAYEACPAGTPLCGDMLDLALAYLAGRELAVLGPDLS
ncbi:MAG: hypothetical protein Q4G43_08400 [Mobilicoccus sp.]|nr:hypothetical protein [Mobilicoccus sp.]